MLGAIVYWTIADFRADRAEFREKMAELGLAAAMTKDPLPKKAHSRAVHLWRQEMGGAWDFRRIEGGGGAMALLRCEQEDGRVRMTHVYTSGIVGGPNGGLLIKCVEFSQDDDRRLEDQGAVSRLALIYQRAMSEMDSAELSQFLIAAMQGKGPHRLFGAVTLRPSGGVYFVPAAKLDQLDAIREYLEGISGTRIFKYLVDHDETGGNLSQAVSSIQISIGEELEELRAQIREIESQELKEEIDSRTSAALERRRATIASKIEIWRDVLGATTDEMLARLEQARLNVLAPAEGPAPAVPSKAEFREVTHWTSEMDSDAKRRAEQAFAGTTGSRAFVSGSRFFLEINDSPVFGTGCFIFEDGVSPAWHEGARAEELSARA